MLFAAVPNPEVYEAKDLRAYLFPLQESRSPGERRAPKKLASPKVGFCFVLPHLLAYA